MQTQKRHLSFKIIAGLGKFLDKDSLPTPRLVTVTATLIIIELAKAIFFLIWPAAAVLPTGSSELLTLTTEWLPSLLELLIIFAAGFKAPTDPRIELAQSSLHRRGEQDSNIKS